MALLPVVSRTVENSAISIGYAEPEGRASLHINCVFVTPPGRWMWECAWHGDKTALAPIRADLLRRVIADTGMIGDSRFHLVLSSFLPWPVEVLRQDAKATEVYWLRRLDA